MAVRNGLCKEARYGSCPLSLYKLYASVAYPKPYLSHFNALCICAQNLRSVRPTMFQCGLPGCHYNCICLPYPMRRHVIILYEVISYVHTYTPMQGEQRVKCTPKDSKTRHKPLTLNPKSLNPQPLNNCNLGRGDSSSCLSFCFPYQAKGSLGFRVFRGTQKRLWLNVHEHTHKHMTQQVYTLILPHPTQTKQSLMFIQLLHLLKDIGVCFVNLAGWSRFGGTMLHPKSQTIISGLPQGASSIWG